MIIRLLSVHFVLDGRVPQRILVLFDIDLQTNSFPQLPREGSSVEHVQACSVDTGKDDGR